jgi:lipopolysaccharide/colanic/teichoic acid biosynthesis glycosyltransferase
VRLGSLIAVLGSVLLLVLGKVCLDLASKQVQGWLFDLCFVMLRLARRRLPAELRVTWHDEELVPELKYILFDKYANEPIVGLYKGFRFAIGHVRGAKRLARESGLERGVSRVEILPARWMRVARRTVDLTVVVAALLVLTIPMLIIGMAIKLGTPGPVLYRQQRIGRGGRPFTMYKFRTMRAGGSDTQHRELIARELQGEDTSANGSWKSDRDPRVTRVGSFLRRTSVDELPQLINVLWGQMSLVGPRPCLDWEAEKFPARPSDFQK